MKIAVVGIGIHRFGRTPGVSGRAQGAHAAREALRDAGIDWSDVQFAAGGSHSAGDADSLVSELGLTGVPFVNVSNGCATGGSALLVASAAIRSGSCDVAMAIGFDKHPRGAFNTDPASLGIGDWYGETGMMLTTQFFAMKIQRYRELHGISTETLAAVAEKAFRNGAANPNAWRRDPHGRQAILDSAMINYPLTQYMYCSPGEGAVALVLTRADHASKYPHPPVYLEAAELRSRRFGSFEVFSPWLSPEAAPGPSVEAARATFEAAGIGPEDVDVAQLQDTDAGAEVIHMAETGLCADGEQEKLVADGATEIHGSIPVNTDGGLIANGEPIGASGLRQMHELVRQLRGEAGERQVPGNPRVGLAQVYGAPGTASATILSL